MEATACAKHTPTHPSRVPASTPVTLRPVRAPPSVSGFPPGVWLVFSQGGGVLFEGTWGALKRTPGQGAEGGGQAFE